MEHYALNDSRVTKLVCIGQTATRRWQDIETPEYLDCHDEEVIVGDVSPRADPSRDDQAAALR